MLEPQKALALYHVMLTARLLDQFELAAVNRGEAWFHISGSGHESSAILNEFLQDQDWLSCHYRDKALLLGRGVSSQEFLNALYGNAESYSGGRQMNPFTSCRARNVMNMSIPVGNGALQCVGVATSIRSQPDNPIVLCSIGDGTSQQGEVLEAIAEAVRSQLPVLFFIQDNQLAVSTKTRGKTFFSHPDAEPEEFYGLPIHRVDGREVLQARQHLAPVIEQVRASRGPAIVIFRTCRLDNHSNADDQSLYRSVHDLEQSRLEDDPLGRLENALLESGITDLQLDEIKSAIQIRLAAEESRAKSGGQPTAVKTVKAALPDVLEGKFNPAACQPAFVNCTMRQAINRVLRHHLSSNHSVFLYGEDIEDPKGDVFGVTRDLSNEFSGRVLNSPLSESTIVGLSIGRALAGDKPVCFIQFADFIPHALNQIMSELATLYWRSNGEWSAPVIVMIACGAYRPGLGPFHAQSMEALMAQVPGLDVFYPSNAGDAAGLLNSAFLSGRPSIFFYPKNALNRPEDRAPENIGQYFLPIGDAIQVRKGNDLSLLAWGNTLQICLRVAVELSKLEIDCDVIDLACISPWDKEAVLKSVQKTGRMIVVEENTHTCGFGAEVAATVAESATRPVLIRRITGPDSYLPFNFDNQRALLPSFESILATAAELLDLDLDWQTESQVGVDRAIVAAIGSGPSDETVEVLEIPVAVGGDVERGDLILVVESAKSVVEMTSPWTGRIVEISVSEHDIVKVGDPVMAIVTREPVKSASMQALPLKQLPLLSRRHADIKRSPLSAGRIGKQVKLADIETAVGSRRIDNAFILANLKDDESHTGDEILRLSGIESRNWVGGNESALTLAVKAARQLLEKSPLALSDIDLIVCSTTSPEQVSPSLACQVLEHLSDGVDHNIQAYDIFAACSGYLYGLQAAYDCIAHKPGANVLVITTEVLSPLLDPEDFDTYILFADAATATLVTGREDLPALCNLRRPVLSGKRDRRGSLRVPVKGQGFITMEGRVVFSEAVRAMKKILLAACEQESIVMEEVSLVVPHQASQRIIDAIQDRIKVDVFSRVSEFGNTSSSSIPLCLPEAIKGKKAGERIGLCAFGAGFTFGAGILEVL